MSSTQIAGLRDLRERQAIAVQQMLESAQRAGRTEMVQSDKRAIKDLRDLDSRIAHLESEEQRAGTVPGGASAQLSARINQQETRSTPMNPKPISDYHLTYRRADPRTSWVRDLMRVSMPGLDDTGESRQRLTQHAQEVQQDPLYVEYRDMSRVDGQGEYAVPPAWLMNQYVELARPGRAFANVVQRQPLPGGTGNPFKDGNNPNILCHNVFQ
jgi:hypothetical protein